ncbi:MAG: hypothetical protein JJV94_06785 [Sulfurospirillum sp.]|nr:hypothetical protein [Sulfurospirillum sp.]
MDNFTTVTLVKEEYNIDLLNLIYNDEDYFYCFSEKKLYIKNELFNKFHIKKVA